MPVRCGSEARLNGARGTCYESGTVSSVEVVIVCSNVSNNCLGRALLLADLAKPFASVRVAGVNLTREPIWPPSSGFDVQVDAIELRHMLQYPGATRWLRKKLAGAKVVVVGRNLDRANEVARAVDGEGRPWTELGATLAEADVVITSTSAKGYVIDYDTVAAARKKRRGQSQFLIDLAVPRDIYPRV